MVQLQCVRNLWYQQQLKRQMMQEKLNDANFLIYAMHNYDNPQCHSVAEFEDDLKKFIYLKKLIYRYSKFSNPMRLTLQVQKKIQIYDLNSYCN